MKTLSSQAERIGLINTYSTLNLGDAAIYSALRALMPQAELEAFVQDDQPDRGLGVSFREHRPRDCDAYVSVGGDIFNNSREWFFTKAFLLNVAELRRHPRRTILFGQSIPRSCHGPSFAVLSRCLRRLAAVCVRDAESHRRLHEARVEARLSFDTAFVLEGAEPARQAAADLFRSLDLDPGRSAVLSVRAFDSMYTHDDAAFVQRMGVLCRGFREAGLTPVVLIQSRAYGADNDLAVARSIQAQAPGTAILDPFLAEGAVPSWQVAMGVFDLAQRVVAVRYHTAVLSLAVGRVPFHLHYSNKGRDLCQRLELPGDDLGRFDPQRTLETILASPPAGFDHRAMRERIRSDFTWAMAQLDPQGKP